MDDGGAAFFIIVVVAAAAALGAHSGHGCGHDLGVIKGRCRELCKPQKFIEPVNGNTECLCTSKRVWLGGKP